jgi:hypothetical protein
MSRILLRCALAVIVSIGVVSSLQAQAVDPTGHWEGAIAAPFGEMRIEIDLARSANGELKGTLTSPMRKLKGFPLRTVSADGRTVTIELGAGTAGRFTGDVGADGTSMTGTFEGQAGPLPFALRRTGDARIDAPPRSAPIAKTLEGTWDGRLDIDAGFRVVLKLTNHADGTATGSFISVDEGQLDMPVAISQANGTITLDVPMTSAVYSATLNAAADELTGTFKTAQGVEAPLTLKRSARQ